MVSTCIFLVNLKLLSLPKSLLPCRLPSELPTHTQWVCFSSLLTKSVSFVVPTSESPFCLTNPFHKPLTSFKSPRPHVPVVSRFRRPHPFLVWKFPVRQWNSMRRTRFLHSIHFSTYSINRAKSVRFYICLKFCTTCTVYIGNIQLKLFIFWKLFFRYFYLYFPFDPSPSPVSPTCGVYSQDEESIRPSKENSFRL